MMQRSNFNVTEAQVLHKYPKQIFKEFSKICKLRSSMQTQFLSISKLLHRDIQTFLLKLLFEASTIF